jgi:mono/diheme cytochrome c family protein
MKSGNKLAACLFTGLFAFSALLVAEGTARAAAAQSGEANFKKFCEACHPYGGNVLRPAKNLSRKVRERNGIKTVNDIVNLLRKPGQDMTAYDEKTLSENDARNIAEYVIGNFK